MKVNKGINTTHTGVGTQCGIWMTHAPEMVLRTPIWKKNHTDIFSGESQLDIEYLGHDELNIWRKNSTNTLYGIVNNPVWCGDGYN